MRIFKLLIDGRLEDGDSTMEVLNPATEEVISVCPRSSKEQVERAVAAAKAAFPAWSQFSITQRKSVLGRVANIIEDNLDELARILTEEQGKPLAESLGETSATAAYFRYYMTLDIPNTSKTDLMGRRIEYHRKPLGVVGAIVPWNFPMVLIGMKVPPALLTGNTLVVKPSPTTPLTTLRLFELIREVVPAGVLNVVTDQNDLGSVLTAHPDVRMISFTGSTATGRKVMANGAETLKRMTLELGGNDAAIVLEDVDPKQAAPKIFAGAFQNNGQVCGALKRLYVHESIYDEMCSELAAIADKAAVGNGLEQGIELGPLQNKMQFEKIKEIIKDAQSHGTLLNNPKVSQKGYFVRPTIVRDIAEGSRLVDEEQFGPVLPVLKFTDVEEALQRANASAYGLAGSVWSSDVDRAKNLARRMDTGSVFINRHTGVSPDIAYCGAKQSGVGIEMGEEGLLELTQLQGILSD